MEYFEGAPYRINIEGPDSTLILDGYTRTLKANVVDQDDNIIVDYETKTIFGTLVGNIVDEESNVILNLENSAITVDSITGSLIATDGSVSYDHETKNFSGQFDGEFAGPLTGDVIGTNNALLVDYTNNLILCNVRSNLLNDDNTVAFDSETNTFQGNFVGNFLDLEGNIILSSERMNTDLIANDNTVAFDKETNTFQGNFVGNFLDLEGNLILSSERINIDEVNTDLIANDNTVAFDKETGTFSGVFTGTFLDNNGNMLVDGENATIKSSITGSVYFDDGSVAVDSEFKTLHGSLVGAVLDADGAILIDSETSTLSIENITATNITGNVTGTFTGEIIGDVNASSVYANELTATRLTLNTSASYEDNSGPLDIIAFHNQDISTSISLARGKGTLENPTNLSLGDKLVSIMFGGLTGSVLTDRGYIPSSAPVAGFEASIDENGSITETGLPGKLTAYVFDSNDDAHEGWVVDCNGDFTATIKNLTVKGETGNTPTNSSSPVKWLEMNVNGETVYMPLYN